MKLIDLLRNIEQLYPNNAGYAPMCAIGHAWEALPKLLAVVEAATVLDKAFSGYINQRSDVHRLREALAALEEEV